MIVKYYIYIEQDKIVQLVKSEKVDKGFIYTFYDISKEETELNKDNLVEINEIDFTRLYYDLVKDEGIIKEILNGLDFN
jgi:hypothetical protein